MTENGERNSLSVFYAFKSRFTWYVTYDTNDINNNTEELRLLLLILARKRFSPKVSVPLASALVLVSGVPAKKRNTVVSRRIAKIFNYLAAIERP